MQKGATDENLGKAKDLPKDVGDDLKRQEDQREKGDKDRGSGT